jgi:two-component system CheB/CheR fusion protein
MPSSTDAENENYPIIVAIGASAGGLKALQQCVKEIKPDGGVAYLVLIHQLENADTVLDEILRQVSNIPVTEAEDKTEILPNHLYILPPHLPIEKFDKRIHFTKTKSKKDKYAPIDNLFSKLGESHKNKAVGAVLSGTGSDGTLGLKAIHMAGGLTIAQEPETAEFDGMPRNAISTGIVDKIIPPDKIFSFILNWKGARTALMEHLKAEEEKTDGFLQKIFHLIKKQTGRDFHLYKANTILRRMERRMQVLNIDSLERYYRKLLNEPEEVTALSNEFLINVTSFFRDKEVFIGLNQELIKNLIKDKESYETIRVWCVGCATGEEAYSVAMEFFDEMRKSEVHPTLQIFASDMHAESLEKARMGFYHGKIETAVSEDRLKRYFYHEDGGYRVKKILRENIVFTVHNVLSDPPFSNLDLIVCRNLLIYLKKETQKDVFELFHYALKPGGHLLLGNSEHLDNQNLYELVKKDIALHRKLAVKGPEPNLPVFPKARPSMLPTFEEKPSESFQEKGLLHYQLVEKIAPPSILLDSGNKVLHVSASAGDYLNIRGGALSKDIFDLLRKEMLREVKKLIYSSKGETGNFRAEPVPVKIDGAQKALIISLRRMSFEGEKMSVLFFEEDDNYAAELETKIEEAEVIEDGKPNLLQRELLEKDYELKVIREEFESNREEMKASNEELQSANEELRSTMEELETSKEELQSMNEELVTLNQENRHKVEELRHLSDDLQNLLASTEIATLFLDRDFKILRFTPKLNEIFNVREADRGRKISDQTHKLGYDELMTDGQKVLKTLQPIEREVSDSQNRTFLTRLLPYRSSDDRIDGIVITFIDITVLKKAEKALRLSEVKYRALIDTSASLIWHLDANGKMDKSNEKFMEYTGFTHNQVKDENWLKAIHEEDLKSFKTKLSKAVADKAVLKDEVRIYHDETKSHRWHFVNLVPLSDRDDGNLQFIGMGIDIDDRKKSEAELKRAKEKAEEAAKAREDFLAHMSHEIRSPLNSILGLTHLMLDEEPTESQRTMLNTLHLSGTHLKKLVNDILDLSQISAGKSALHFEKDNLTDIIEEIAAIFQYTAEKEGLDLIVDLDEETDKTYELDRLKITQILNNLLSNAFKFTKEGNITLSVKLLETREDKDLIKFAVKDTGIGIGKDKMAKIFDNFGQADSSTKREYGGTGLGLTLCKKYLEIMDSEIKLESIPGDGSEFSFELELKRGEKTEEPKKEKPPVKKSKAKRLKIMVVDDSEVNRMVLNAFLKRYDNVEVQQAKGGREAIRLAKEEKYDLILMDIRMPIIDGYAATEKIRQTELNADTEIIALTADVSGKVEEHINDGYFQSIITKPIEPSELEELIERMS